MLRCGDGTLYTGWTNDVQKRLKAHNAGRGGKYTRSRLPVELVYQEYFETKSQALKREIAIKRLRRKKKLALIESGATPLPPPQNGHTPGSSIR
ncbi:MAG: GIY-YIG nuclease family protein [Clostridiales Family XIII bacterium]|nr:GIY-YIG nuclease family protein [Clostridiales Family XIII bacterium]